MELHPRLLIIGYEWAFSHPAAIFTMASDSGLLLVTTVMTGTAAHFFWKKEGKNSEERENVIRNGFCCFPLAHMVFHVVSHPYTGIMGATKSWASLCRVREASSGCARLVALSRPVIRFWSIDKSSPVHNQKPSNPRVEQAGEKYPFPARWGIAVAAGKSAGQPPFEAKNNKPGHEFRPARGLDGIPCSMKTSV